MKNGKRIMAPNSVKTAVYGGLADVPAEIHTMSLMFHQVRSEQ